MAHAYNEPIKEEDRKKYKEKLNLLIANVKDDSVRSILGVSSKNSMYPKDCITDGGLEKLVKYILLLEKK